MKKTKLLFMLITICILGIVGIQKVDAAVYSGRFYEVYWQSSKVGVFAKEGNGWMDYNGLQFKSTKDSRTYYCIEPETPLEGAKARSHSSVTGRTNIINSSKLTSSKYNRVLLLAYYGYGYKDAYVNHTAKKWYGITQVMIWRTMRPDLTWTFKTSRYGKTSSTLHASAVKELNNLVANHSTKPSFSTKKVKVMLGKSISYTDSNKVFANFKMIDSPKYTSVTRSGNKITIKANKVGTQNITFSKTARTSNKFTLYKSSSYQDLVSVGTATMASFDLSVEVTGGYLNIQKVDSESGKAVAQAEASLKGAVYGVYNSSKKLVGKITTDANGKGKLIVDYGTYTIKELTAPKGYKLSDKVYTATIAKGKNNVTVNVSDEVKKGEVKITKKKGGAGEEFVVEAGAEFDVINNKGVTVQKLVTDENGVSTAKLPYGTYTIRQTKGAEGYSFVDDFKVEAYEEKLYEFELENIKISKLEFTKTDFSSGEPLPDTLIEVYTENDELIFSGRTDENGKIEVPNLLIGKYYILEKEAPKYYLLNEEKMWFEITSDGRIVKCEMKNKRKEGNLEFTKKDITGKKFLEGALIEIYFMETNEKVFSNRTDKNGKIYLEGLIAGKYCLYEKEAPEGYQVYSNPVCFEIDNHGETVKVSLKNAEIVEVPDTGLSDYKLENILGIGLVVIGVGYIVYEIKKKKKK